MKKRLLAMLLCVATLLSLCTGFASAASSTIEGALGEVNIFNGGYKLTYLSMIIAHWQTISPPIKTTYWTHLRRRWDWPPTNMSQSICSYSAR